MIVNVEFFDNDPIENVITSLNFEVDKTLFFGYEDVLQKYGGNVERFLKKTAGVREVEFCPIDRYDLSKIMTVLENCLKKEQEQGHQLFFDLTGGETLPLVAFGALSRDFKASMHRFDVKTNEMYEYRNADEELLSEAAKIRVLELTIDEFVALYGGVINYGRQKSIKELRSKDEVEEVKQFWKLTRQYQKKWPYFVRVLQGLKTQDGLLEVWAGNRELTQLLNKVPQAGGKGAFLKFLEKCEEEGFLSKLQCDEHGCGFAYKDETIRAYFWDSGSILELYACILFREAYPDAECKVGVHIDWDGIIHMGPGEDVLNEVDIMLLDGNLPIFISCKNGNVNQMALYELETVANRFGGKYAKKIMAVSRGIGPGHQKRADEMGIEVRKII